MAMYQKFIPTYYFESVYEIDYETLKRQGIKTLFFDLDNTLMSYDDSLLGNDALNLLKTLEESFNIVIISNSKIPRVSKALSQTNFKFVHTALKPLKRGYKKALKIYNNNKNEVIIIGDQLMTDIYGAWRFKIKSILVKPILKRSDVFTTKINRKLEKSIIKKIKKKDLQVYEERIKPYED